VTGGSGIYAGASGNGNVTTQSFGPPRFSGVVSWSGTLVADLRFDLTALTIEGAANKRIRAPHRAKRVRVVYTVTARDDADGVLPMTCSPRSGARFALGRTRVQCSAADTSGNQATATFSVTVKRRR